MEYKQFLNNAYRNSQLNEKGLTEFIGILNREIIDLKQKVMDLEYKLQYKKQKD